MQMINKPEILYLVSRKAAAMLGRQVSVMAVDKNARSETGAGMSRLLNFGRDHSDIVNIKE